MPRAKEPAEKKATSKASTAGARKTVAKAAPKEKPAPRKVAKPVKAAKPKIVKPAKVAAPQPVPPPAGRASAVNALRFVPVRV